MVKYKLLDAMILGRAVTPLVGLAEECVINYAPWELSFVVSEPDRSFRAALRARREAFDEISCYEMSSARINVELLCSGLNRARTDYDFLFVHGGQDEQTITLRYFTPGPPVGDIRSIAYPLVVTDVFADNVYTLQFSHRYSVVVCIPAPAFSQLLMYLRQFGDNLHVIVTIRKARLIFEVGDQRVALPSDAQTSEPPQCTILGVEEVNPVQLVLNLSRNKAESLRSAIELAPCVWLFQSQIHNCLMQFPIDNGVGLYYYFL